MIKFTSTLLFGTTLMLSQANAGWGEIEYVEGNPKHQIVREHGTIYFPEPGEVRFSPSDKLFFFGKLVGHEAKESHLKALGRHVRTEDGQAMWRVLLDRVGYRQIAELLPAFFSVENAEEAVARLDSLAKAHTRVTSKRSEGWALIQSIPWGKGHSFMSELLRHPSQAIDSALTLEQEELWPLVTMWSVLQEHGIFERGILDDSKSAFWNLMRVRAELAPHGVVHPLLTVASLPEDYALTNPRVAENVSGLVGEEREKAIIEHFLTRGQFTSALPSAVMYVASHPELHGEWKDLWGEELANTARHHWEDRGRNEGKKPVTLATPNLFGYWDKYTDLQQATNGLKGVEWEQSLLRHWFRHGIGEGRIAPHRDLFSEDNLWTEVQRLANKKPVIQLMGIPLDSRALNIEARKYILAAKRHAPAQEAAGTDESDPAAPFEFEPLAYIEQNDLFEVFAGLDKSYDERSFEYFSRIVRRHATIHALGMKEESPYQVRCEFENRLIVSTEKNGVKTNTNIFQRQDREHEGEAVKPAFLPIIKRISKTNFTKLPFSGYDSKVFPVMNLQRRHYTRVSSDANPYGPQDVYIPSCSMLLGFFALNPDLQDLIAGKHPYDAMGILAQTLENEKRRKGDRLIAGLEIWDLEPMYYLTQHPEFARELVETAPPKAPPFKMRESEVKIGALLHWIREGRFKGWEFTTTRYIPDAIPGEHEVLSWTASQEGLRNILQRIPIESESDRKRVIETCSAYFCARKKPGALPNTTSPVELVDPPEDYLAANPDLKVLVQESTEGEELTEKDTFALLQHFYHHGMWERRKVRPMQSQEDYSSSSSSDSSGI